MRIHLIQKSITFLTSFALATQGFAMSYTVSKGDTLSGIAQNYLEGPIYGLHGSLNKILRANPQVLNPDVIRIGDHLILPDEFLKKTQLADNQSSQIERIVTSEASKPLEPLTPENTSSAPSIEFHPYSSVGIYPTFGFARLDTSLSGSASAASKPALGLAIDWTQYWSKFLQSQLYLNYMNYDFETSENSTLQNQIGSFSEFGLGVGKSFSNRIHLDLQLGFRSSSYLRAVGQNIITIEDVQAGVLKFTPKFKILSVNKLSTTLLLPTEYEFSGNGANISTLGGFGYGLGLEITHETSWGGIKAGSLYRTLGSGFDRATTQTQEIKSYLGLRLDIEHEDHE